MATTPATSTATHIVTPAHSAACIHSQVHPHTPGSRGVGSPRCDLAPQSTSFGTVALRERQHLAMTATCPEGEALAASRNWNHGTHFLWGPQSGSDLPTTCHATPPREHSTIHFPTFHSCADCCPWIQPRVVIVWRHVADVLTFGFMDTRYFLVHLHRLVVRWHSLSSVSSQMRSRTRVWFQAC